MGQTPADANLPQLQAGVEAGLVSCSTHQELPLKVWNYTTKAQLEATDTPLLKATRGVITDSSGAIIARSFDGFSTRKPQGHQLRLLEGTATSDDYEVHEKMDGSLIIAFWHEGKLLTATRNSFDNREAKRAKELLTTRYDISPLDTTVAYSFEGIFPRSKILVDYGNREELVFLAAFAKDGTEVMVPDETLQRTGFSRPTRYYPPTCNFEDMQAMMPASNFEGFVVRFKCDGTRIKVKSKWCLQKLKSKNDAPINKAIRRSLVNDKPLLDCVEGIADELKKELQERHLVMQQLFDECLFKAAAQLEAVKDAFAAAQPGVDLDPSNAEHRAQLGVQFAAAGCKEFKPVLLAMLFGAKDLDMRAKVYEVVKKQYDQQNGA